MIQVIYSISLTSSASTTARACQARARLSRPTSTQEREAGSNLRTVSRYRVPSEPPVSWAPSYPPENRAVNEILRKFSHYSILLTGAEDLVVYRHRPVSVHGCGEGAGLAPGGGPGHQQLRAGREGEGGGGVVLPSSYQVHLHLSTFTSQTGMFVLKTSINGAFE